MSAMQPPQRVPGLQVMFLVYTRNVACCNTFASATSRLSGMAVFHKRQGSNKIQSFAYHATCRQLPSLRQPHWAQQARW